MRKRITLFLLLNLIFYVGCAPAMQSKYYLSEGENIPQNDVEKNVIIVFNHYSRIPVDILSVRENSVIVTSEERINDLSKEYNGFFISEVFYMEIHHFYIVGISNFKSRFSKGFKIASFLSTLVWTIGVATAGEGGDFVENKNNLKKLLIWSPLVYLGGGIYGGLIAAVPGGIFNSATRRIIESESLELDDLKPYAQFPINEPKELGEMFPG